MEPIDLKSRAGQLLYRELPEEYRYQDPPPIEGEFGDLEAYLHGFGHLLDLVRGTTEQAYADAFAEGADNGRDIQSWLIPYLAELVGAELRAPDPMARRRELNETVSWFKGKGSLNTVDEISQVVADAESVVVEGWRRTLTTPRMKLPPFAVLMESGVDPSVYPLPLGTPDVRYPNRAVLDETGNNPLYGIRNERRDTFGRIIDPEINFWKPLMAGGAPCFPGAYDDTSMRTPDLRSPQTQGVGPHPKRTLIHVRPPEGFFPNGLGNVTVLPSVADIAIDATKTSHQRFGPRELLQALGLLEDNVIEDLLIGGEVVLPDRVLVSGDLTLPSGVDVSFHDLMFTGTITLDDPATRLSLDRCAVDQVVMSNSTDTPALTATDCLFNSLRGGVGFAQLVYCTVLEQTELERLWASDCIFIGPLIDIDCSAGETCIRYSRVPDLAVLSGCSADQSPSNTEDDPNFIRLWFKDGDDCVSRPARFGEPGAGVLDLTSSSNVLSGAEDEGEMGAYHHKFHAARIRALHLKLTDYLPIGQEIAIQYDPYLSRSPLQAEE